MNVRKFPVVQWLRTGVSTLALAALLAAPATATRAQGELTAYPGIERDTEIEAIFHDLMDPVWAGANMDPKTVELYLVNDPTLNAATLSGHHMIVNSGLIMQCKTPNELEGVLAHETGHMERGDVARVGEMSKGVVGPMLLGLGLGVLAALAGAPDAAAGLIYSGQYFGEINGLAFSRDQESRADEAAITYLEKAGYSGQGIVEFFNKFRYEEVFSDIKKYPYWVDHPLSDERIESLAVRAKAQPHWGAKDTPQQIAEFELMKAKIKAFMNRPYQTYIDYPESDTSFAARYARAIADYRELETDKALKEIDALIAERPDDPYLYELKGQTLMESARAVEGEAPLRKAVELNPNAPLLRLLLGQDLLAENDHAKVPDAIVMLNRSLLVEPDDPMPWQYLAQAYDAKGDEGMARLASAEQNFHLGQMKDARAFAIRARGFLKRGTPEWNRATDIVLTSNPSADDLRMLGTQG
ncbi:MAG TPA: M48 family metalloprotease [Caulobacteraceae bacterium]|nr:M48 family metalloprotease [Caulobacteraceae bacterium]